jgi:hypothetical protein
VLGALRPARVLHDAVQGDELGDDDPSHLVPSFIAGLCDFDAGARANSSVGFARG